jgi:predicted enzyme related to lactoylglutathione lyase
MNKKNDAKIQDISMAWVVVKNLDASIKFYTEVVGLKLCEHHKEFGWAELEAENSGARLGLAQASDREEMIPGQNAVVGLTVADIVTAKNRLKEGQAQLVGEILEVPGHVKLQTFTDPDGNKFQLAQVICK